MMKNLYSTVEYVMIDNAADDSDFLRMVVKDYEKAFDSFSWEPKHSLQEGTRKTIAWFKKYLEKVRKK